MLGRSSAEIMTNLNNSGPVPQHMHVHGHVHPHQQQQTATALPPAVLSHPLRLKTEPSTADHGVGGHLPAGYSTLAPPTPSKASEITAGMNKVRTHR
jgi:hypothetical protein